MPTEKEVLAAKERELSIAHHFIKARGLWTDFLDMDPAAFPEALCEEIEEQPEGFPASAGFAPCVDEKRDGYLAGATAYAKALGHSGLISQNETLRKVRDDYSNLVTKSGFEAFAESPVFIGGNRCAKCGGLMVHYRLGGYRCQKGCS